MRKACFFCPEARHVQPPRSERRSVRRGADRGLRPGRSPESTGRWPNGRTGRVWTPSASRPGPSPPVGSPGGNADRQGLQAGPLAGAIAGGDHLPSGQARTSVGRSAGAARLHLVSSGRGRCPLRRRELPLGSSSVWVGAPRGRSVGRRPHVPPWPETAVRGLP